MSFPPYHVSQESALLEEEAYNELESQIDLTLLNDVQKLEPYLCIDTPMNSQYAQEQRQSTSYIYDVPKFSAPQSMAIESNEEFDGYLNFNIEISSVSASKSSWVYSPKLCKIYIKAGCILPIEVKVAKIPEDLYLRATMLFSLAEHGHEMVKRCVQHMLPTETFNKDFPCHVHPHVLRCMHPSAEYLGSLGQDQRLSVMTKIEKPAAGSDVFRVNYQFVCKNSCNTGINRRPTEVIFCLENQTGQTLGRKRLKVRICSCPRRDKMKDEQDSTGESSNPCQARQIGTKLRIVEANDEEDSDLIKLQIEVVGKENALIICKVAEGLMATMSDNNDAATQCRDMIRETMEELKD